MNTGLNPYRPKLLFLGLLVLLLALAVPLVETEKARDINKEALPDFAAMENVKEKKEAFFDFLQPYVESENERIRAEREKLLAIADKIKRQNGLTRKQRVFIERMALKYEIDDYEQVDEGLLQGLIVRVDIIPNSLVLAQAANESAWGTSRFAREGNNFFGQWCYSKGCGIVPKRRSASARHEVKRFTSVADSVHAYFMNINTFPSYQNFRRIRARLRAAEEPIDGLSLSEGLRHYSQRGMDYIEELKAMIISNALWERNQG